MKKKFYNEPEIEIISYALEDVIRTSLAVDEIVPGEDDDDFVWGAPF